MWLAVFDGDHSVIPGLVIALLHVKVELPLSNIAAGRALQPVSHSVTKGSPHRPNAPGTSHASSPGYGSRDLEFRLAGLEQMTMPAQCRFRAAQASA